MKYRKFGSVFLLLMMIVLCLYGSRVSIAKSIAPAAEEQTVFSETRQTADNTENNTAERVIPEKEKADSSDKAKERSTREESLEVTEISGETDYSDEAEYEYNVEEIECGQGQTARVERFFYPNENRAEVSVDSELLSYTAKLQSRESEEFADTLILTMDVEIVQDGNTTKSQQIEWQYNSDMADYSIYYGTETVDIICPNFQDANRDGYLDFLVLNYFTSREGWHTIFVWDTESEEYVQVKIEGSEYAERISSDPKFYDGYLEQWSIVGFFEQRFEQFRWEGNELILEDEIRMQEDAE